MLSDSSAVSDVSRTDSNSNKRRHRDAPNRINKKPYCSRFQLETDSSGSEVNIPLKHRLGQGRSGRPMTKVSVESTRIQQSLNRFRNHEDVDFDEIAVFQSTPRIDLLLLRMANAVASVDEFCARFIHIINTTVPSVSPSCSVGQSVQDFLMNISSDLSTAQTCLASVIASEHQSCSDSLLSYVRLLRFGVIVAR